MDTVRGRQGPTKSQQDVRDESIRFAATGGQWRVWVSCPQVDGGCEGALGLGCRSWAPLGVPWTESSAPFCVAADPELFIKCRGQSVQLSMAGAAYSQHKGRRSRARQRVPRTSHSYEVSRRTISLANDK